MLKGNSKTAEICTTTYWRNKLKYNIFQLQIYEGHQPDHIVNSAKGGLNAHSAFITP